MRIATFTDRPALKIALLVAFAAVYAYLLQRNLGTHPYIFADEWYYSKMARLQPLADAMVPSYLYMWLFRTTNACGNQFYQCVQVGNILLFMAAAPFVYMTARLVAGKPVAALVALLSALAPLNVYTAYFMPEATYYFGFCVLGWVALTRSHWHWAAHAAATGFVLGLMSLVKVHALFLIPALCLFLVYARWTAGGRWIVCGVGAALLAAAVTVAVRFGLGYLLAGPAGFNLFGNFYQGAVNAADARSKLRLVYPGIVNFRGHLMALALLLPLPLAMLSRTVLGPPPREQAGKAVLLQLFALLVLGAAAGVTILYTASIANPGLTDEGLRLHLRYYSFVFPLLWMVAASSVGKADPDPRPWLRWTIAGLLAVVLVVAVVKLPTYALNPVDGPDVISVNPARWPGRVLIGLDLLILLLWARGNRLAAPLFLLVALPVSIVAGTLLNSDVLEATRADAPPDRAAAFVRANIPAPERKLITIAGTDVQQLLRTQMEIDDPDTTLMILPYDAPIEQYQLPVHNKYLLVLGKHPAPEGVQALAPDKDFTLLNMKTNHHQVATAALSAPVGTGLIASVEGMSSAEPWGRWSDSKQVVIHFNQPLPRHLRVVLKAQAFGDNTELPFVMRVGDKSEHFRLGWGTSDVGLVFETDGATRDLTIDVPHPVAPSQLGRPGDNRTIGIGITEIEVGELEHKDVAAR